MPAITPALLKKQSLELAGFSHNPEMFVKILHEMLEEYADWSYKPGEIGASTTLTTQYHVPNQVLKQITNAVFDVTRKDPQAILALCEKLWHIPVFECRVLAARLLEQMDNLPDQIIVETISNWQPHLIDSALQRTLFRYGFARLIKNRPHRVLTLIDSWLDSKDSNKIKSAITLLEEMTDTPGFENGPAIFRRITPFIRSSGVVYQTNLISLLMSLARNFPNETMYLLIENLQASGNPEALVFARSVIDVLPNEARQNLRKAIQIQKDARENDQPPEKRSSS